MQSCLGIYVEDNLIKYAKVRKEKDNIKVEAFNVEFYENLNETLKKIINETNSSKIPICMNVSNELYNYFEVFSMLGKKDVKKSLDIEFEMLCNEKSYNLNSLETRFVLMKSRENQERYKALHIAANKSDINLKAQALKEAKLQSLTPISTSITNLVEVGPKDNIAIINIEQETKITIVIEGQIYRVDVLQEGMGKILEEINKTENSMKKSYEVCKNITIYTQDTQSSMEENEHIENVMPTLYKIITGAKNIIDNSLANIDKVYITGLGTAINNIDLYFQEYMVNVKCEILKPFFTESSSVKIPIKEYIEVNSAIALALDGVGYANHELNFVSKAGYTKKQAIDTVLKLKDTNMVKVPLDFLEKGMSRLCIALAIFIIGFVGFSNSINKSIEETRSNVNVKISEATVQLKQMDNDLQRIKNAALNYSSEIKKLESLTETQEDIETDRVIEKDSIPNMLNKIMFLIPQQVKITRIENSSSKHIKISAESEKYEQLGYFTSILKTEGVLTNIKSTSGLKSGSVVKVVIEGELP